MKDTMFIFNVFEDKLRSEVIPHSNSAVNCKSILILKKVLKCIADYEYLDTFLWP